MSLNDEQFRLVSRSSSTWLTLWLISDFEGGRAHAVAGQGGGTYCFGDERGHYETSSKGMAAWRRGWTSPDVTVTWGEVKRWVDNLPTPTRATAAALLAASRDLQRTYPSPYPGIGRAYSWDQPDGGTPEEREQDRADLEAAHAQLALDVEAWRIEKAAHDARAQAFLAGLAPSHEVDLLDLLAGAS